ncbi:MAG TPA: hypothetical protein VFR09_01275 [Alphaproteobacteria bacterium]|nr:hypothetical protein [Alphaproteobacteria bacterium]
MNIYAELRSVDDTAFKLRVVNTRRRDVVPVTVDAHGKAKIKVGPDVFAVRLFTLAEKQVSGERAPQPQYDTSDYRFHDGTSSAGIGRHRFERMNETGKIQKHHGVEDEKGKFIPLDHEVTSGKPGPYGNVEYSLRPSDVKHGTTWTFDVPMEAIRRVQQHPVSGPVQALTAA